MNVHDEFRRTAERQPEQVAVIEGRDGRTIRYRQLAELIDVQAARMAAAGVARGACVGVHLPSGLDTIVATYAIWSLGACAVPIAPELVEAEKAEISREIALDWIVAPVGTRGAWIDATGGEPRCLESGLNCRRAPSSRAHPADFRRLNPAFLRFTSGTTSVAKGVVLSHETILARIHAANEVLRIGEGDRILWLLSMSYHFAVTICAYLHFGATCVVCREPLGEGIVATGAEHDVTIIYGSPTHFRWMSTARSTDALPRLRLAISTTAALPPEVGGLFERRFGIGLSQAYGIIEVGLPCINTQPARWPRDSVGPVLPAYEIAFDDRGLGPEQREILIRGPGFLDAYYEPWRTRDEILVDGWFATGDLGFLDANSCLHLRGRCKEVISVGGMKFFPQEVESVLRDHPAIEDARVFAVADERLGETCQAEVVWRDGSSDHSEDDVLRYCARRLAAFKVPERIHRVDQVARTASGKLRR